MASGQEVSLSLRLWFMAKIHAGVSNVGLPVQVKGLTVPLVPSCWYVC